MVPKECTGVEGWFARGVALALLLLPFSGCLPDRAFECADSDDCDRIADGLCLPDGACAYPEDPGVCPSGLRRSPTASDPGACVPADSDGTSTKATSTPQTSTTAEASTTTTSTGVDGSSTSGSSSGSDSSSSSGSSTGSSSSSSSETAGPQPIERDEEATVAVCLYDDSNDPSACEPQIGRFVVDGNPLPARTGYLRFDVADPPAEGDLLDLRLELSVPEGCSICEGEATGDVYAVQAFDQASLSKMVPAQVAILAPGVGPVVAGESIEIDLPTDALQPDGSLFIALVPTTANEVHFWSTTGLQPPRLRMTIAP